MLQTISPVLGRFYDYYLKPGENGSDLDQLIVTETDFQHDNLALELLDAGDNSACSGWGDALPLRLRELHSHWLCRERGAIVVRPLTFRERDTSFIITYTDEGSIETDASPDDDDAAEDGDAQGSGVVYDCRRIPSQLRSIHWTLLLGPNLHELADQLVLLEGCAITAVLSKFEEPRFIHTHRPLATPGDFQRGSCLLFELPRYNLEFELSSLDGAIRSRNYAGYRLRRSQQLVSGGGGNAVVYTLPEFRHYLVLERDPGSAAVVGTQRADVLVLVPAGLSVARRLDGSVMLAVPQEAGEPIRVSICTCAGAQLFKYWRISASDCPKKF